MSTIRNSIETHSVDIRDIKDTAERILMTIVKSDDVFREGDRHKLIKNCIILSWMFHLYADGEIEKLLRKSLDNPNQI